MPGFRRLAVMGMNIVSQWNMTSRRPQVYSGRSTPQFGWRSILVAAGLVIAQSAAAVDHDVYHDERQKEYLPALGIGTTFGRWVDVIDLGYDPVGATGPYADNDHFLGLLVQATQQWEMVSGLRFNILEPGSYPNDRNNRQQDADGIVSVKWLASAESFAGRAGPLFGPYQESIGHFVYNDGTVEINSNSWQEQNDAGMVRMLVHEIGHLIGLGHSDNPASVMYANPYNHLHYPREDDIRAVQAMYGPPQEPLPDDLRLTNYMFAPGVPKHSGQAILQILDGNQWSAGPVNVDKNTPDDYWVGLQTPAGITSATITVVDPAGYPYRIVPMELDCLAYQSCTQKRALVRASVLKTLPGEWKFYITDGSEVVDEPVLLHELTVPVAAQGYNQPPMAHIQVRPGISPTRAQFSVLASDIEGDNIELRWHIPGPRKDRDFDGFTDNELREAMNGNVASEWQEIDFRSTGTHTFFVQVNDDAARYEYDVAGGHVAGSGFQTLLRVTVKLSATSAPVVDVVSSSVNTYQPSIDWPLPFTGTRPDPDLQIPANMIAHLAEQDLTMRSCVRILSGGQVAYLDGLSEIELKLQVLDVQSGDARIVSSRQFNPAGRRFSSGELPDCSGEFETTTNRYTDFLKFGDGVYRTVFDLVDDTSLSLELRELTELGQ